MKKFILGFVTALALVAAVYGAFAFLPGFFPKKEGPLYDNDVKKAKEAVLCDAGQHSCRYFERAQDAGDARVIIVAQGNPVRRLEVDMASRPGSPQYYVKLTDNGGVALFSGLPAGDYVVYFNGVNFPKEYGNSPTVPVVIAKGQTAERRIELGPR